MEPPCVDAPLSQYSWSDATAVTEVSPLPTLGEGELLYRRYLKAPLSQHWERGRG
jgi:hypothetical protein